MTKTKQEDAKEVQGAEIVKAEQQTGELSTSEDMDNITRFRRSLENFKKILNKPPRPNSIQKHDGHFYIPISFVMADLDRYFFGLVQYEVVSYQQVLNEFVVHARIKVFHPVLQQWMNYDGLGCGMFQQKKDTPISDFYVHKTKNAGKITVPNAYSEAIKNAAKKLGKRFGADLNRQHEDHYTGILKEEESKPIN